MKNKIVKLTERDLQRIVDKVINEDFGTKLVSRGKGLIAALKARSDGEGRDVRQLIRAITRLKSTATQAEPLLNDMQKDLTDLFNSGFMSRVKSFDSKLQSNKGLEDEIKNFEKELGEYKILLQKLIEKNEMIMNLDLSSNNKDGVAV